MRCKLAVLGALLALGIASTAHAQDARVGEQAARAEQVARTGPSPCPTGPADVEEVYPREPVDLNHADEAALVSLPGIGSAKARAILAFRASRGRFRNVSQLLQVKGIGRALLKRLRPLVTLG